jgi:rhodanese-related sulfurtransferase
MKKKYWIAIFALIAFGFFSCQNTEKAPKQTADTLIVDIVAPPTPVGQLSAILAVMQEKGNAATSGHYPAFIMAKNLVHLSLKKNAIFDLRTSADFAQGHIKGAKLMAFSSIPDYWASHSAELSKMDTIVLVDLDGQTAAYTAGLLRLNGFSNVYSLKFGMTGWNSKIAEKVWASSLSSAFENKLDTTETLKPIFTAWPLKSDSVTDAHAFFEARWKSLFAEPLPFIGASNVFASTDSFFIINYDRKDRYQSGHIPSAVRYKPQAMLGNLDEMATLPANKAIAVYCNTGQNAAYVTAYLRLTGYDAKIIHNGCNAFMHDKMLKEKADLSWVPLETEMSENFPVVK